MNRALNELLLELQRDLPPSMAGTVQRVVRQWAHRWVRPASISYVIDEDAMDLERAPQKFRDYLLETYSQQLGNELVKRAALVENSFDKDRNQTSIRLTVNVLERE